MMHAESNHILVNKYPPHNNLFFLFHVELANPSEIVLQFLILKLNDDISV